MNAIQFDTIAHDGIVTVTIPEADRQQWDGKNVRVLVLVLALDEPQTKPKASLLTSLKQIKISGPEDFAENHDAYLNGIKHV